MTNLLSAQFSRLFKSKLFYATLILFAIAGLVIELPELYYFFQSKEDMILYMSSADFKTFPMIPIEVYADGMMLLSFYPLIIVSAVLVCIFIGKDFGDNTIRNKLISGNTRTAVYLSNLIVCVAAEIMMQIIFMIAVLIPSTILYFEWKSVGYKVSLFSFSFKENLTTQLIGLGIMVLCSSMYMLFLTLSASRSRAVITSMAAIIVMIISSQYIEQNLYQIDYYTDINIYPAATVDTPSDSYDENGYYSYNIYDEYIDNRGKKLSNSQAFVLGTVEDILPTSQANWLLQGGNDFHGVRRFFYDFGISAVINVVGIMMFSRKDLK